MRAKQDAGQFDGLIKQYAHADGDGFAKPMRRSRILRKSEASHLEIDNDAGT